MVFPIHSQLILGLIFLFELNFNFSLVVFLFTCGILTLIFCFFLIFLSDFLKNGFFNSLIVHSKSSFAA